MPAGVNYIPQFRNYEFGYRSVRIAERVEIFESDEDDDSSIAPSGRPNNK
jgi:hypothetical protein